MIYDLGSVIQAQGDQLGCCPEQGEPAAAPPRPHLGPEGLPDEVVVVEAPEAVVGDAAVLENNALDLRVAAPENDEVALSRRCAAATVPPAAGLATAVSSICVDELAGGPGL